MTDPVADELAGVVDEAAARLRAVSDQGAAQRPAPGKWSPKEIVGHLIDSAANNHQRFVRAPQADGGELVLPGYAQDRWVALQDYQGAEWMELIDLWSAYNRHLAHVIRRIPPAAMATACRIGAGEPVTLRFLVDDYLDHLKHHLRQLGIG
jgi:hypothetical protein